jgi:AcrR family transcriptional regulator
VKNGLILINKIGFEEFTFKKLSIEISTTEASIYRYFENKHQIIGLFNKLVLELY